MCRRNEDRCLRAKSLGSHSTMHTGPAGLFFFAFCNISNTSFHDMMMQGTWYFCVCVCVCDLRFFLKKKRKNGSGFGKAGGAGRRSVNEPRVYLRLRRSQNREERTLKQVAEKHFLGLAAPFQGITLNSSQSRWSSQHQATAQQRETASVSCSRGSTSLCRAQRLHNGKANILGLNAHLKLAREKANGLGCAFGKEKQNKEREGMSSHMPGTGGRELP